jgi:enoyl-CoA hydratase/carnithine racemase
MDGAIHYGASDGVARITLDRTAKRNAITSAMYTALAERFDEADRDATVPVLVLEGAGGTFTAGNDLHDFLDDPPAGPESPVRRFLVALATARKPLVAAVDGWAVGIGVTVLLHADLVVASEDAWFQMPFVDLGLVPEAASSLLLPRLVGSHKAAELLLLAERFDAAAALACGLVNRVVAPEDLAPTVGSIAAALAAKPAGALQLTKELLRTPVSEVTGRIELESAVFAGQLDTPEATAALRAFFEARGSR